MNRLLCLSLALAASALLLTGLLAGSRSASVHAQQGNAPTHTPAAEPGPVFDIQILPTEGKISPPKYPNLDSDLNHIVEQARTGRLTERAAAASAPMHQGESVAVTLYIGEGYADTIASYLEANGASPRNIGADYIEAYIPVSLLVEAPEQEGVLSVRTIIPPHPDQGTIVSGGVAAHGVPPWHAAGYKGSGVKIGVIDLSFEGFTGLMGSELPATVNARCHTSLGIFTTDLSDCISTGVPERSKKHGTAVTEAVFDIAPEADYYIADTSSYSDLLSTVNWMVSQGVDVINMSLSWGFTGPGDGTTPYSNTPLRSLDAAVSGGIIWVNSAGNSARDSWCGAFSKTRTPTEFTSSTCVWERMQRRNYQSRPLGRLHRAAPVGRFLGRRKQRFRPVPHSRVWKRRLSVRLRSYQRASSIGRRNRHSIRMDWSQSWTDRKRRILPCRESSQWRCAVRDSAAGVGRVG